MLVIGLGQLKSIVLHVKDWLQDTLTALSLTTTFASLIPSLAPHWQHRSGLSKGCHHRVIFPLGSTCYQWQVGNRYE